MDQISKKQLNRITWIYAGIGLFASLAVVLLQKYVLNYWLFSEGGTVVGVMTIVMAYAARAAYKVGLKDGLLRPEEAPSAETA